MVSHHFREDEMDKPQAVSADEWRAARTQLLDRIHPGRVYFDLEGGVGMPSRWNTLCALRVLKWWDGIA